MNTDRTATAAQADVSLSRPTSSALAGKNTVPLKTLVPDEFADDFQRFAKDRGYGSASDCMREVLMVSVYGSEWLANLHRQRIESLARNGSEIGTGVGR